MKIFEFPQPYLDLYGAHQLLAQLGYSTSDLYVGFDVVINWGPDPVLFVQLRTQGKRFAMVIGPAEGTKDSILRRWIAFSELLKTAPVRDVEKCWQKSALGRDPGAEISLVSTLHLRGFEIPFVRDSYEGLDLDALAETYGQPLRGTSPGGDC